MNNRFKSIYCWLNKAYNIWKNGSFLKMQEEHFVFIQFFNFPVNVFVMKNRTERILDYYRNCRVCRFKFTGKFFNFDVLDWNRSSGNFFGMGGSIDSNDVLDYYKNDTDTQTLLKGYIDQQNNVSLVLNKSS